MGPRGAPSPRVSPATHGRVAYNWGGCRGGGVHGEWKRNISVAKSALRFGSGRETEAVFVYFACKRVLIRIIIYVCVLFFLLTTPLLTQTQGWEVVRWYLHELEP